MSDCDGGNICIDEHGFHQGYIKRVKVTFGSKSLEFNYCDHAIQRDRAKGLNVEILNEVTT